MCLAIEEMCKEECMEGRMAGRTETVRRMLCAGKYALEDIVEISGLELSNILKLKEIIDTESVLDK